MLVAYKLSSPVHLSQFRISLDLLAFHSCCRRIQSFEDDEATSNTVKTTVMRRMQYGALHEECEELSMKARQLILSFWTQTCEKHPDMARMQVRGRREESSIAGRVSAVTIHPTHCFRLPTLSDLIRSLPSSCSPFRCSASDPRSPPRHAGARTYSNS